MDKKNFASVKIYTANDQLDKRWYVEIKENGKRKRRYGNLDKFKTVKERKAAILLIAEEFSKTVKIAYTKTLADEIQEQIELRKGIWRKKTYQCKKSKTDVFINWMKRKPWTKESVGDFFSKYLIYERKVSATTYNDYLRMLKQALTWCGKEDIIEDIEKRKGYHTPATYFTNKQKDYIVAALKNKNPELLFFIQFVYYCFLRPRSELRLMKVGDVILEDKKILIPAHIAKNKKQQYVAIPDVFYPIVKKKLENRNPNEYIFQGTRHKQPSGMNTFGRQHRELLKELGFDTSRYKLYSWKHTGAVQVVKAGVHIKQLQIQLRHHSLDQVDEYLRQLGVSDLGDLQSKFPSI